MPEAWYTHDRFVVLFLLTTVGCLFFKLGYGVCALSLSLMFCFIAMQYTIAVNFRTDG